MNLEQHEQVNCKLLLLESDFYFHKRNHLPMQRFHGPLPIYELTTQKALQAARLLRLFNKSYHLIFPHGSSEKFIEDFKEFYTKVNIINQDFQNRNLENYVFSGFSLFADINLISSKQQFVNYAKNIVSCCNRRFAGFISSLAKTNQKHASFYCFLLQADQFIRYMIPYPNYSFSDSLSKEFSILFKIFIKELGYGDFESRRSCLFNETLTSVGLSRDANHCSLYDLPSWIHIDNYFSYIKNNPDIFFRYLGALYLSVACAPHINACLSQSLKTVFGNYVNTSCFDDDIQASWGHSTIVLDQLICCLIERLGPGIIPEIVIGLETLAYLRGLAEQDLLEQIAWGEALIAGQARGLSRSYSIVDKVRIEASQLADLHDHPIRIVVDEGIVDVFATPKHSIRLREGDQLLVPSRRLKQVIPRCSRFYRLYMHTAEHLREERAVS